MDWLDKMNAAMEYIESHLTDDIDYNEIARKARCSEYHFRRMFPFITGVSLSGYIRRRRLTLAVSDLRNTSKPVSEIAKNYRYDSPDSFTRSFKKWHGITPSEVRKGGQSVKAYPRMTFHLSIQGGTEMKYRIEEKKPFTIVGIKKRVPIIFEGENPEIKAMWKNLDKETIGKLKELTNTEPMGLIQASTNFSEGRMEEQGELDHYIGVATTKDTTENYDQLDVPATSWAVFEVEGPFPETLQTTWGRIYSEWFPESEYELSEGPEILWNEETENSSIKQKSEIWIPVRKSQ